MTASTIVDYFRHEYDFPPHFPYLRLSQDVIEEVKLEEKLSVAPTNGILRHLYDYFPRN